ncbi:hypothetical protein JG688_00011507 [Phytophthora aleatoria]|uniref:TFIIS N-terminal domain-containing protein n=1 Tax=Phytophthora aleatoria TaxID=2496075 RepID=A0A8J5IP35_9STRA|nr:hypothetical protein JG688_00011507 [Phytophthora aleatoria]
MEAQARALEEEVRQLCEQEQTKQTALLKQRLYSRVGQFLMGSLDMRHWWCGYSPLMVFMMRVLELYPSSDSVCVFYKRMEQQFGTCRKCVDIYHASMPSVHVELEYEFTPESIKAFFVKLQGLDADRIQRQLTDKSMGLASALQETSETVALTLYEVLTQRRLLSDFRIWASSRFSDVKVNRSLESLRGCAGLYQLLVSPESAVREWAQVMVTHFGKIQLTGDNGEDKYFLDVMEEWMYILENEAFNKSVLSLDLRTTEDLQDFLEPTNCVKTPTKQNLWSALDHVMQQMDVHSLETMLESFDTIPDLVFNFLQDADPSGNQAITLIGKYAADKKIPTQVPSPLEALLISVHRNAEAFLRGQLSMLQSMRLYGFSHAVCLPAVKKLIFVWSRVFDMLGSDLDKAFQKASNAKAAASSSHQVTDTGIASAHLLKLPNLINDFLIALLTALFDPETKLTVEITEATRVQCLDFGISFWKFWMSVLKDPSVSSKRVTGLISPLVECIARGSSSENKRAAELLMMVLGCLLKGNTRLDETTLSMIDSIKGEAAAIESKQSTDFGRMTKKFRQLDQTSNFFTKRSTDPSGVKDFVDLTSRSKAKLPPKSRSSAMGNSNQSGFMGKREFLGVILISETEKGRRQTSSTKKSSKNEEEESVNVLFLNDGELDNATASIVKLLKRLGKMDVMLTDLRSTSIGKAVNKLRKHEDAEIKALSSKLKEKWTDLMDKKDTLERAPRFLSPELWEAIKPQYNSSQLQSIHSVLNNYSMGVSLLQGTITTGCNNNVLFEGGYVCTGEYSSSLLGFFFYRTKSNIHSGSQERGVITQSIGEQVVVSHTPFKLKPGGKAPYYFTSSVGAFGESNQQHSSLCAIQRSSEDASDIVNSVCLPHIIRREMAIHPKAMQLHSLQDTQRQLRNSIRDFHNKAEEDGQKKDRKALAKMHQQLTECSGKIRRLRDEVTAIRAKMTETILSKASIIACTLSKAGSGDFSELKHGFDALIIDEAAQAVELSTLVPIRERVARVVLVGDPKQLPATVKSVVAAKARYDRSLFERIAESGVAPSMLRVQYRMHPFLRDFPSKRFYGGMLTDGPSVMERVQKVCPGVYARTSFQPFLLYDVENSREEDMNGSKYNRVEAAFCVSLCQNMFETCADVRNNKWSVGFVSPYKEQVRVLRQEITRSGIPASVSIEVNTVDGFQGREKDVIVFSCVRSSKRGGIGFLRDIRRLNVAITRARFCLFVVGNVNTLVRDVTWAALVKSARDRRLIIRSEGQSFPTVVKRLESDKYRELAEHYKAMHEKATQKSAATVKPIKEKASKAPEAEIKSVEVKKGIDSVKTNEEVRTASEDKEKKANDVKVSEGVVRRRQVRVSVMAMVLTRELRIIAQILFVWMTDVTNPTATSVGLSTQALRGGRFGTALAMTEAHTTEISAGPSTQTLLVRMSVAMTNPADLATTEAHMTESEATDEVTIDTAGMVVVTAITEVDTQLLKGEAPLDLHLLRL